MTRLRLIVACLVLLPITASAQTDSFIAWDFPSVTPAVAQGYAHTVSVDGVTVAGVPTCAASSVPQAATCKLALPAPLSQVPHVIAVTVQAGGVETTATRTVDPSKAPGTPGNIHVTVTVTVVQGQ